MESGQIKHSIGIKKLKQKSIIAQVRSGDVFALINWIGYRKDKLYKIARVYGGGNGGEDIFEKMIINMLENIKKVKDEKDFEPWVVSILLDECRKAFYQGDAQGLSGSDEISCDNEDTVINYVRKLKGIGKDIMALKYYGGYPAEEIAEILDMPIADVRHNMYLGLKEISCMSGGKV